MKLVVVILNVTIGVGLLLLFLTMIGNKEYAGVVLEGPVFFTDLFIVGIASVGPIAIAAAIRKDLGQYFAPALLVGLGTPLVLGVHEEETDIAVAIVGTDERACQRIEHPAGVGFSALGLVLVEHVSVLQHNLHVLGDGQISHAGERFA